VLTTYEKLEEIFETQIDRHKKTRNVVTNAAAFTALFLFFEEGSDATDNWELLEVSNRPQRLENAKLQGPIVAIWNSRNAGPLR
jgi:hypothetical protein